MARSALKEVNKSTERQVKKTSNKVLETRSKQLLNNQVRNGSKLVQDEKISLSKKQLSKACKTIPEAEKENTPILTRSKRKILSSSDEKCKADSPVTCKTRKQNAKDVQRLKSKDTFSKSMKKNSVATVKDVGVCQDKLKFSHIPTEVECKVVSGSINPDKVFISSPSGLAEDSGFESSSRISNLTLHSPVCSVDNEAYILTCESPPLSYWKDLAEQRRIALERALHENESLHDQLDVLQAENSQLKEITRQAEELAQIFQNAVENE